MKKKSLLALALNTHIELQREILDKDRLINNLRSQPRIAREAIERYCPPELCAQAHEWLETKGSGKML